MREYMQRFWWVNHKQTVRQEIGGGYLWSPKREAKARSQFYDNMREVAPGDLIISYANARVGFIGVASDYTISAPKPEEFGAAGVYWSDEGWFLPVIWQKLPTPVSPKALIDQIGPLLPTKYSPIAVLVASLLSSAVVAQDAKPDCYGFADPVRVMVGDVEFHIPSNYHPQFSNNYPNKKRYNETCKCYDGPKDRGGVPTARRGYCQDPDDPPFEVDNLSVYSDYFAYKENDSRVFPRWLGNIDINIRSGYANAEKMYCDANDLSDIDLAAWKPYNKNSAFNEAADLAAIDSQNGQVYYKSKSPLFFGMPIVIKCSRKDSDLWGVGQLPDGTISKTMGRRCNFTSPAGDTSHVVIRFHDKLFQPQKWVEGFRYLESYLLTNSSLVVPKNGNISCSKVKGKQP